MALQRDCLQFFWKAGIGNLLCLAVLSQQEFVAKIFAGIAAVQKRRLQNGEPGKGRLDAGSKNRAACLLLQVPVAADMVCVGVGIDDSFRIPALLIQDFPDFARKWR